MNTLKKAVLTLVLAVLALFAPLAALGQQYTLTQTTLSAAIGGTYLGSGTSTSNFPAPVLVQVASATGIVGINPNLGTTASQPNQTALYVDRELMLVLAVNANTLTVVRGASGTVATPHASGAMVLVGRPFVFYTFDPGGTPTSGAGISGVACSSANTIVTPWVNVRTGAQWLCSSVSGTWVPGWNNSSIENVATATVASAAGPITPSGPLFSISGTAAITGFNIPLGFNGTAVGGGCFTAIPTAIWTWTAAGNIAVAGTTTAAQVTVTFCWNAATSKWQPSRIA